MSNEQRIAELKDKRTQINSVSCSFCTAKWLQTTLYLQNGYNHSCHHPAPHKISLEEIKADPSALHNSKFKKKQRAMMLKGERPHECDYCWKIEDLNKDFFSDRHYKTADYWAWDRFNDIAKSNPNDNVYPSYLEVSFSNSCNFACAYCSPEISSKWMEDIKQHGEYPVRRGSHNLDNLKKTGKFPYTHNQDNPYVTAFWKWFPEALPHLKVLRITGGEPTMSKDTWKLLDYINDNPQPQLEIAVNTNLNVPAKLIDKLIYYCNELTIDNKLKKLDIYTSAESVDDQCDYVRDGMNYKVWYANVNRILTETNSSVAIMTTINILSLPKFADFINAVMDLRKHYNLNFENNRIPLSINYLRWPPHLQCTLLSKEDRIHYADIIGSTCKSWLKYHSKEKYARLYLEEWDQIKRFCEYLVKQESATNYREDFIRYIQEYDKRRNKNFNNTFPQYSHLLGEWHAC
tara:strand:- start:1531 stop:2913 length:1383 start_codon:yes stop_codon:yes gene_type:complete